MIVHYLQHAPFEGPGFIEAWAAEAGHEVSATRLHAGGRLPALKRFDLLVVMGGPMNVYEETAHPWLAAEKRFIDSAIEAGKPVLGVCLGAQLLAAVLGARVYRNVEREIGWFEVLRCPGTVASRLAGFWPERAEVLHWHGDTFAIPAGAVRLAQSAGCENQGFVAAERLVGLQFHLEIMPEGARALIENCRADFKPPGAYIQDPAGILSDESRFRRANRLLVPLLEGLAALSRQNAEKQHPNSYVE